MSKEEFEKRWLPEDKGGACSAPASAFMNETDIDTGTPLNREAHLNDLDDRCTHTTTKHSDLSRRR